MMANRVNLGGFPRNREAFFTSKEKDGQGYSDLILPSRNSKMYYIVRKFYIILNKTIPKMFFGKIIIILLNFTF